MAELPGCTVGLDQADQHFLEAHELRLVEAAFAREVCEETGLRVADVQLVRVVSGYRLRLEVFFRARVTGETKIYLQDSEVLEARFFP